MEKYTDDDIRKMDKITCKIAADYLGEYSAPVEHLRRLKLNSVVGVN